MKRRDFCKALVCSAALAPGLALPRAEAAAKSQTVGRAVPAGNYTMSFRSELSQMDIEHEYYYSDSFFAHSSIQYDHQLALATLGMVTAAFNTPRTLRFLCFLHEILHLRMKNVTFPNFQKKSLSSFPKR